MFGPTLPDPPPPAWTWSTTPVQPPNVQRCPICEGRGTIPAGFRDGDDDPIHGRIDCSECGGRGMLVVSALGSVSKLPTWQP
jgi:hypothetical protein